MHFKEAYQLKFPYLTN